MIEALRIKQVSESDIDNIIGRAGGHRLAEQGSADYHLNEAIIELKLVQEEGFEKDERQKKLANLFKKYQPGRPVVVINPKLLDAAGRREYYNIVSGPIQTHVKKAGKQLKKTASRIDPAASRVLLVINFGYTALSPDEFKAACIKCARNNTTNVDWLVCAGIYYHSDGFDNTVLVRFEPIAINIDRPFPSREGLLKEWDAFLRESLTEMMRSETPPTVGKFPVSDLDFESDGVRFVKPAPAMPPSSFWPGGRQPRRNSRENEMPGPLAQTFPALGIEDWERFKIAMPTATDLKSSYSEWLNLQEEAENRLHQDRCPFVPVPVKFDEFVESIGEPASEWQFFDICKFAKICFDSKMESILESAKDQASTSILPVEYIHLSLEEIGSDKANDLCTIRHVFAWPGLERNEVILENVRAYWEEGMTLAACYALKRNVEILLYQKL